MTGGLVVIDRNKQENKLQGKTNVQRNRYMTSMEQKLLRI